MKYATVQVYVEQVQRQCQFIVMAHAGILAASAKIGEAAQVRKRFYAEEGAYHRARFQHPTDGGSAPDPAQLDLGVRMHEDAERELWYSAQAMMTAVANVDKTLWLNRGGSEKAREPVRRVLGVDDDSASMEQARDIRNYFDHYDKKINEWAKSSEGLKLSGIGGPLKISGHSDKAQWQSYDPATDTLSFWDLSVALAPIAQEARRLIPIAEDIASKCPGCMDEGKEHPVTFPIARGFPAGDAPQGSPAEGNGT
jgi:hypothetical protein